MAFFCSPIHYLRVNVTVLNWGISGRKINAAADSGQGPDVVELGYLGSPVSCQTTFWKLCRRFDEVLRRATAILAGFGGVVHIYIVMNVCMPCRGMAELVPLSIGPICSNKRAFVPRMHLLIGVV